MSRFLDFVLVMVGLVGILVIHTGSIPIMKDMRDEFNEDPATGNIDQESINNGIFQMLAKWLATIPMAGLFVIAGFREYRRQRVTAVRRRRV